MTPNTLFLRLEGPLQAWGNHESKFVIRRTGEAPTKSGVIGLLCAALGLSRKQAEKDWLAPLSDLRFGVRIDRPGIRWWDFHTVGAGMMMRVAEKKDKHKPGAMLTRREYLNDASFLVALQGKSDLIEELASAVRNPKWPLYLGRKCCIPSRPLLDPAHTHGDHETLLDALRAVPWQKRLGNDIWPNQVDCLSDWLPSRNEPEAPPDAMVWYDVPLSLDPPSHKPRFVVQTPLRVGRNGEVTIQEEPVQKRTKNPPRPRANYQNTEYRRAREKRLDHDSRLCVFCKSPATTVQHVTYRRANGGETQEDLRSLCRLCHDAVTMIEYGQGMGLDRINPEQEWWRDKIIEKRSEIIRFRSLETRRRRLDPKEVE